MYQYFLISLQTLKRATTPRERFGNAERFARNGTLWERNDTFWEQNETIWGRNELFWERNALSDRWTERFERFVRFGLVFSFLRNSDYLADRPFLFILATTIWK